jgi:formate hydrogenlyase subunit 3/multisubunit Na+/H+ antiporter MnhD subunit
MSDPFAVEAVANVGSNMVESALPMLAVFLPLFMPLPIYLAGKKSEKLRDLLAIATAAASFALIASLYPIIQAGSQIVYNAPILMLEGMTFYVDATGFIFATVTSLVWLLATIYSVSYMTHERSRDRFFAFLILTLAVDLGVLVTGDLFSLFIFFELLGLSSWVLVIHTETQEAMKAGKKYLFMGVIGGLFLLFGIFLIFANTGTLALQPLLGDLAELGSLKYLIAATMTLGFGVKAGMFPVHVWLPEAHPVAPSPASALLSGIMVKAGVYGIIRTLLLVFSPTESAEHLWHLMEPVGGVMIWIGVITMTLGMVLALLQSNLKRLLAYSTISQIGYIIFGIGIAVYLGFEGAIGLAGAAYHFLNHALYKSLLFLMAGAVYYKTHELDMHKLGGLWKKMPLTFLLGMVGVLGIAGIPFFNGYASKFLLFEGIVEVAHENQVFLLAELMFLLVSGGTIAYYLKMVRLTFFGKPGPGSEKAGRAPLLMLLPMTGLAGLIAAIGWYPNLFFEKLIFPVLGTYTFDHHGAEHLLETSFFTAAGFQEVALVSVIGVAIFTIGWKKNLLETRIPRPLGPDYWYERLGSAMLWLAKGPMATLDSAIDRSYEKTSRGFLKATKTALEFDEKIDQAYLETGEKFMEKTRAVEEIDKKIDHAYFETGKKFIEKTGAVAEMDRKIDSAYISSGKKFFEAISPEVREDEGLMYLREPLSVFDQTSEEFFTEVATDLVEAIKYPYAFAEYLFDILVERYDETDSRTIKKRADDFESQMGKLIYETPNISGITIAVFIIVGMLAIYLFTSTIAGW